MKYRITTLGCKVNEYESGFYQEQFEKAGFLPASENEHADVVVINTCTVTNTAAAKSRQKIRKARKENPGAFCVVAGCYAQIMEEALRKELEADLLIGASHKNQMVSLIQEHLDKNTKGDLVEELQDLTEFESMPIGHFEHQHRAFLKIEDGCNQYCSYCQIPLARGPERSAVTQEVIDTARKLADAGHKEIVLTGIHTGRYSFRGTSLSDLLKLLLEQTPEDVCYRISSIEITEVSEDLIALMQANPRVLPHLHIPVQSGCTETLMRMKRPYTIDQYKKRIEEIRQALPQISISTDIMCGFVQESEEEFAETLKNTEEIGFSFLHVFPYSRRKGTAADSMSGFVDSAVSKARTKTLLNLSEKLRKQDMERFDCGVMLVEKQEKDGTWSGYTEQYHPVRLKSSHPVSGRTAVQFTGIKDGHYEAVLKGDEHETF